MIRIHSTADVSPDAQIGDGAQIWHQAQVREGADVGRNCIIGKGVYIDFGVRIGDNCKLQNGAYVYHGATLEDGVFVGPGAILTNDRQPRAINPDGGLKGADDWLVGPIHVGYGASLGTGCIVLPAVTIGAFAMVGAGAVVTRDVPAHGLVVGTPARLAGYVCSCGARLVVEESPEGQRGLCSACGRRFDLSPSYLARSETGQSNASPLARSETGQSNASPLAPSETGQSNASPLARSETGQR
jgi:UDP-2-acetamido-3-amino-2,3-dideoxy-glucuronate N-acetyltransferase